MCKGGPHFVKKDSVSFGARKLKMGTKRLLLRFDGPLSEREVLKCHPPPILTLLTNQQATVAYHTKRKCVPETWR